MHLCSLVRGIFLLMILLLVFDSSTKHSPKLLENNLGKFEMNINFFLGC